MSHGNIFLQFGPCIAEKAAVIFYSPNSSHENCVFCLLNIKIKLLPLRPQIQKRTTVAVPFCIFKEEQNLLCFKSDFLIFSYNVRQTVSHLFFLISKYALLVFTSAIQPLKTITHSASHTHNRACSACCCVLFLHSIFEKIYSSNIKLYCITYHFIVYYFY